MENRQLKIYRKRLRRAEKDDSCVVYMGEMERLGYRMLVMDRNNYIYIIYIEIIKLWWSGYCMNKVVYDIGICGKN